MNSAIIVAAGRGTRMGPNVDKIFLQMLGMPVVAHTWMRFEKCPAVSEIILVVKEGMQEAFHEIAHGQGFCKKFQVVVGGAERQDSVWNGLQALSADTTCVAIQDGARPCTPIPVIEECFRVAAQHGASVAAQAVTDTIKESSDGRTISGHLDRSKLFAVQTPQTFQVPVILKALKAVRDQGLVVTDDTAACALIGQPVQLVLSRLPNPKVTVPTDIPVIEQILCWGDTGQA